MSTDRDLTRLVRSWLKTDEHESAGRILSNVIDRLDTTPQRRPLGRAWRETLMFGTTRVAAAAIALLLVVAIAITVYVTRPGLAPAGSPSPSAAVLPSPMPTGTNAPTGTPGASTQDTRLVAYSVTRHLDPGELTCPLSGSSVLCSITRIWVVSADGGVPRQLMPDLTGSQDVVAWSPDGSMLLFAHLGGLGLTDLVGSAPELLPAESLCPLDAASGNCQPNVEQSAFSPDGSKLAYSILEGQNLDTSTIVIFDLATRQVTRLEATQTKDTASCRTDASEGVNEFPSWSPDGARLVFARQLIGPLLNGNCQMAVYTVNADGSDLRRLLPADMQALSPRWSPDGSFIALNVHDYSQSPGAGEGAVDIYVVQPDGTDLQRLTHDGASFGPRWLNGGRLLFSRWTTPAHDGYELWAMDANGASAHRLGVGNIPSLTSAGCSVCPYGVGRNAHEAFWQPLPR